MFVFEVQCFKNNGDLKCKGFHHLGYLNKKFKTKQLALNEYSQQFPNMRRVDAHKNTWSDWDPNNNNRRFILRKYVNGTIMILDWT